MSASAVYKDMARAEMEHTNVYTQYAHGLRLSREFVVKATALAMPMPSAIHR